MEYANKITNGIKRYFLLLSFINFLKEHTINRLGIKVFICQFFGGFRQVSETVVLLVKPCRCHLDFVCAVLEYQ